MRSNCLAYNWHVYIPCEIRLMKLLKCFYPIIIFSFRKHLFTNTKEQNIEYEKLCVSTLSCSSTLIFLRTVGGSVGRLRQAWHVLEVVKKPAVGSNTREWRCYCHYGANHYEVFLCAPPLEAAPARPPCFSARNCPRSWGGKEFRDARWIWSARRCCFTQNRLMDAFLVRRGQSLSGLL